MGQDLKGNFGPVSGGTAWNQNPLYVQATDGQRQELDDAMDRVERFAGSFEHIQSYGQAVMQDATRFCGKCQDLLKRKTGVDVDALTKEFKNVERRMDLHVLGAREILRRYNEEYIPDAVRECSVSDSPQDTRQLSVLQNRQQDITDRLSVLLGTQAVVRKTWAPFAGQAPELVCAVPILKKIVLKKPPVS